MIFAKATLLCCSSMTINSSLTSAFDDIIRSYYYFPCFLKYIKWVGVRDKDPFFKSDENVKFKI